MTESMNFTQDLEGLVWNENSIIKDSKWYDKVFVFALGHCVYALDTNGHRKFVMNSRKQVKSLVSFKDELYVGTRSRVYNWSKRETHRLKANSSYLCKHNGKMYAAGDAPHVIDISTGNKVFERTPNSTVYGLTSNGEDMCLSENFIDEDDGNIPKVNIHLFDPESGKFMTHEFKGSVMALGEHDGTLYYSTGNHLYSGFMNKKVASSRDLIKAIHSDGQHMYVAGSGPTIDECIDGKLHFAANVGKMANGVWVTALTTHPRFDFVMRGILKQ